MGIIIISAILLIVGITLMVICDTTNCDCFDDWYGVGLSLTALATFALVVFSAVAMIIQIPKEKDYQQSVYERQVLEYRLENKDDNIVGNELLYKDIVEFNNNLRQHKRYANNFWIGIFHNDKIATIEYIEIEGVENYKD